MSGRTLGGKASQHRRAAPPDAGSYNLLRGVPELVLADDHVFFLSPGILPGAVALGLHNYGIVGRLTAEVVENLDPAPARALRASGAGNMQVLLYAILPQAIPHFITYLLYRWEVIIRTTVVVGFVSAGGLGREFTLRLSWFHYTDVTLLIIWYLLLVAEVDLLAAFSGGRKAVYTQHPPDVRRSGKWRPKDLPAAGDAVRYRLAEIEELCVGVNSGDVQWPCPQIPPQLHRRPWEHGANSRGPESPLETAARRRGPAAGCSQAGQSAPLALMGSTCRSGSAVGSGIVRAWAPS